MFLKNVENNCIMHLYIAELLKSNAHGVSGLELIQSEPLSATHLPM